MTVWPADDSFFQFPKPSCSFAVKALNIIEVLTTSLGDKQTKQDNDQTWVTLAGSVKILNNDSNALTNFLSHNYTNMDLDLDRIGDWIVKTIRKQTIEVYLLTLEVLNTIKRYLAELNYDSLT